MIGWAIDGKCTPPTLVSICSSQSDLSAKLYSMSVHQSVQELEFYSLLSSQCPCHTLQAYLGGLRCLVVKFTPPTLVSICSSPLEFYCILSRLMHIWYTRGILGWATVGCPSNAHPQLWCLSAPHHASDLSALVLLTLTPWVCIDLFKSQHTKQVNSHIILYRRNWVGLRSLSIESTLPTLVCICSAPLHHICLLNFIPWVWIDPFKS